MNVMKTIIYACILCLMFTACCKQNCTKHTCCSKKNKASSEALTLNNQHWQLKELNQKNIDIKVVNIYIIFKDSNQVKGFGGCNNFMGSYTDNKSSLQIGPLLSTKMACDNDALEYEFTSSIEKTTSYSTDYKYLYLKENDKIIAKLEAIYF